MVYVWKMYVLIHGAYHGAWCWGAVQRLLPNAVAPNLPGHGGDPGWLSNQTLDGYTARIVDAIDAATGPITLVGHSMGGAIAAQAADARPDRVAGIVFLTAYIPIDGEKISDVVKTDPASHVQVKRLTSGEDEALSLMTGTVEDAFYNDADASQLGFAQDRVQLQSPNPFQTPLTLSDKGFGSVGKAAIICLKDRAISPGHQRWMAERVGCDPIIDLDVGHSPFVTAPDALVAAVQSAAKNF